MKQKSIELIAVDKNQDLQYQGKCKLRMNRLSSMLSVEPIDEDYKMISAMFEESFVMDKNILFVFDGEEKLNNFMLVFDAEKRCKIVYDFICKNKSQNDDDRKDVIQKRFWIPFFKNLSQNDGRNIELKRIIKEWIDKHENEEKEELIKILKESNVYDIVYSSSAETIDEDFTSTSDNKSHAKKNTRSNEKERTCNLRKRKYRDRFDASNHSTLAADANMNRNTRDIQKTKTCFSKIIKNYKFVNVQTEIRMIRRLLVFTSGGKKECLEYAWSYLRQSYYCIQCKTNRKEIAAVFDKDGNGNDCIKMEDKEHVCEAIPYIPEKYVEMKIYKKPDYQILENCNTYSGKMLIIFDEEDKCKCWEFRAENGKFLCRQCKTPAKLWNEDTEDEHVELMNAAHSCKFVPYESKKYYQFNDFVVQPNFEIQTIVENEKKKKQLIIFDKDDRNLCYVYSYSSLQYFVCRACRSKGLIISAKVLKNSDGEEYVLLSQAKHVCELHPLTKESVKKKIVLRPPKFELINVEDEKMNIIIFDSNDQSLCYIFCPKGDKYYCRGCHYLCYRDPNAKKNFGDVVRCKLCKDKNDEYFVQLIDSKHICKPIKYEPEKYVKKEIQKCYEFFFFRRKRYPNSICVGIYHPENRKLCFGFSFIKKDPHFRCNPCLTKGQSFNIRIEKDDDGKEYFKHEWKRHVCEPLKVSSMCAPNFIRLKRSDLVFEKSDKKLTKIKQSRIFKAPNFEFRFNHKNVKDGTLYIFHSSEDRNFAYKYFYSCFKKTYICNQLKKNRCHAKAEIHIDENGEKCVISDLTQHKCVPVKYEAEEGCIIDASNFVIVDPDDGNTRIFVFTTPAHDECYEFSLRNSTNIFKCLGCNMTNMLVTVKLRKDEDGNEFLQMSKQEHVCVPRKYIKEKYEPKIILSDLFELHPNTRGEENKRLIVFTSEKKEFMYEYYCSRSIYFTCLECISMKERKVFVKLDEDKNGNKFLKCGQKKHICEPRKYDPKKYVQRFISSDLFELHPNDKGEKDKYLVLFTSEEKELGYKYSMHNPGYYQCLACRLQKKTSSAYLMEDENGIEFLKLGENGEHVCEPQIYDPKKYIQRFVPADLIEFHPNSKGEIDKHLVLFTSEEKKLAYTYSMIKPDYYICLACKCQKKTSSVYLMEDENGIKSIKLGDNEHVCEPEEYDPKKYVQRFISSDLFELHPNNKGEIDKHLVLFTSEEKKFAYTYSMLNPSNYKCLGCRLKKKTTAAYLMEDENGIKFLKLGESGEHVCEPQIYDPKKYVQRFVPADLIEFHPNNKGEIDKHMVLFTSEEKKLVYKYYLFKPGYYKCLACKCKNKTASAYLMEDENGIKTIKLGDNEHVCKPVKYDPKKFKGH